MINSSLCTDDIDKIVKDPKVRKELTRKSHYLFFHIYFARYVKYPTADFQKEIFELTEKPDAMLYEIIAFRGSAKSTIMSLSLPIWSLINESQKKYILLLSQTQQQARQALINIKRELESNALLINDFGPFDEDSDEWRTNSLVIPKFDARISAASTGESIRGVKHGEYRPDLIIADDVEDLSSVKTKEGRDKTYDWFTGEIVPAGDVNTRIFLIGNLLHDGSLMVQIKEQILSKKLRGIFREYPLVSEDKQILWAGKFPNNEAIEALKATVPSESAWSREYLLKIIYDDDRVIKPEWIHRYSDLPQISWEGYQYTAVGVDIAVSEKEHADYSAIVAGMVFKKNGNTSIYILPYPVNKHLTFPELEEAIRDLARSLPTKRKVKLFIEDVGAQKALVQRLQMYGYDVEGIVPRADKRTRLGYTAQPLKYKTVQLCKYGCDELVDQLSNFDYVRHDDLADAFSLLVNKVLDDATIKKIQPNIRVLSSTNSFRTVGGGSANDVASFLRS